MLAKRNDNWGLFQPWRTVGDLHKEFLGLFDELSEGFNRFRASYPKLNLNEDEKEIVIQMALPGYNSDQIEIEVVSNFLVIRGERSGPELGKGERFLHQERSFGKFEESIKLPSKVKSSKVKAKLVDGILTITMPKLEEEKAQTIKITE
ncbi:MAG: Hsp20/alpha crystallin family protein [Victivallaceae bacterium]|nr:Hsp20/alpha crystallin family protein [Victivallaceae bacterium]